MDTLSISSRRTLPGSIIFLSGLQFLILLMISCASIAAPEHITLYLSADRTGARASGVSIEQGIRTALSENGNKLGGINVTLKILDHRGSTPRAKGHLKSYLEDPSALALFAGLHSPPLIATRDFINERSILVLVPWAAATPITRFPSDKNWIFRLSIDDSKAGLVITNDAITRGGIQSPALLLEDTGWGRANHRTMTRSLEALNYRPTIVQWFNWGISINNARMLLRNIIKSGADAVIFVGNAPEGKVVAKAMASLPDDQRLPIFSHWGITGGDFAEDIGPAVIQNLNLSFIQTSFSFLGKLSYFQQQVLEKAKFLFPDTIRKPADIKAPTGFIHAYDITRLLIEAANRVTFGDDIDCQPKCT